MPDDAKPLDLFQLGRKHQLNGDLVSAAAFYRAALDADPNRAAAWNNLSHLHVTRGDYAVALACARRAVEAEPVGGRFRAIYLGGMGRVLWAMQRYDEAETVTEAALEIDPDLAEVWHNAGSIAYCVGEHERALKCYARALEIEPVRPVTEWDRAWALMASGDFVQGLEAYELRWDRIPRSKVWEAGIPLWDGENVDGKTVLVHHEQGYGDTLHFVRYCLPLRASGAVVKFAAPPALFRLLSQFAFIEELVPFDGPYGKADYHVPVMSIARHLGMGATDYFKPPYLFYDGRPFLPPRAPGERLRIGLVWSGSRTGIYGSDFKSIAVEHLMPLAEIPGVQLYSLQKSDGSEELAETGADSVILDYTGRILDFADLALAMKSMDLVISVDTGPLHLAGALGVPTIGLIPFVSCWRYRQHEDDGVASWLYPTVRLFRQHAPKDWPEVIERVCAWIRVWEMRVRP